MTRELRICLEDAVGRRVIACGIHGIGASLIQGRREPDVPGGPASDCDLGHRERTSSWARVLGFRERFFLELTGLVNFLLPRCQ